LSFNRWTLPIALCWCAIACAGALAAEQVALDVNAAIRTVVTQLEKKHPMGKTLDRDLAGKWLAKFLDQLDPRRMYFLESDLKEFQQSAIHLNDLARRGDFATAQLVRKRYRRRVKQAAEWSLEFLSGQPDYSIDEEYPVRYGGYAKTAQQLRERWRLRLKAERLVERVHGRANIEVTTQLHGRYKRIA